MAQVSSTDFSDYNVYTEEIEWNERTKMEYYAAEIKTEIQRSFVDEQTAKKLTAEKNFIKFVFRSVKDKVKSILSPKEQADKAKASKGYWLTALGIKKEDKK